LGKGIGGKFTTQHATKVATGRFSGAVDHRGAGELKPAASGILHEAIGRSNTLITDGQKITTKGSYSSRQNSQSNS
jgi:hypothetical protein